MTKAKSEEFDYSTASTRLDEIVAQLQSKEVSIDEALLLHTEGIALVKDIEAYLVHAEHEIKKLNITA